MIVIVVTEIDNDTNYSRILGVTFDQALLEPNQEIACIWDSEKMEK